MNQSNSHNDKKHKNKNSKKSANHSNNKKKKRSRQRKNKQNKKKQAVKATVPLSPPGMTKKMNVNVPSPPNSGQLIMNGSISSHFDESTPDVTDCFVLSQSHLSGNNSSSNHKEKEEAEVEAVSYYDGSLESESESVGVDEDENLDDNTGSLLQIIQRQSQEIEALKLSLSDLTLTVNDHHNAYKNDNIKDMKDEIMS